jgi:CBS domain containing-hemolysin-like protein
MTDYWAEALAFLVFLGAAAFFAASEAAIVGVSRIAARTFAEKNLPGAAALEALLADRNRTLTSVLIANTFVLLATNSIATALLIRLEVPFAALWSTFITTVLLLLFGEIIPKTLAVSDAGRTALRLAIPLKRVAWVLQPLTAAFLGLTNFIVRIFGVKRQGGPYVTEEDIKQLVNVGVEQKVLEEGERELIHSVIEFADTIVREVMTPRTAMVTVGVEASPQHAIDLVIREGYSKLPVFEGNVDNVIGVVHDRELLIALANGSLAQTTLASLMRPVVHVPESKRVFELLREMQRGTFSLAIVVDEYGGTAGLATMEDLLEEIVGEIRDEHDEGEEEPIRKLDDGEAIVEAGVNIEDVNAALGIDLPHEDFETIGGLTVGLFGRMPAEGEEIETDGVRLRVDRTHGRRILAVRVHIKHDHGGEETAGSVSSSGDARPE